MEFGILMGDQPVDSSPTEHLDLMLRKIEAAQEAGFNYLTIGQHFLYDGFRWLQPIPLLSRLAAELDDDVKLGTTVLVGPVHHPVILAEELATLDIITRGRLVVGIGTGYLPAEYETMGVPFKQRYGILDELIEVIDRALLLQGLDVLLRGLKAHLALQGRGHQRSSTGSLATGHAPIQKANHLIREPYRDLCRHPINIPSSIPRWDALRCREPLVLLRAGLSLGRGGALRRAVPVKRPCRRSAGAPLHR